MIRRLVLVLLATALPLLGVVTTGFTTGTPPAAASTTVAAYWLVASDGGIFSFGGAPFYGSTGGIVLNKPIVGMAAVGNPLPVNGRGYWLVASDGGVFSYGDAQFYGSTGSMTLNKPIVGMASTPDGKGYWLVASDGGIFSYGDAQFYGSTGSHEAQPAGGGHGVDARREGLLAGGVRRRDLLLRRRAVLREHRQHRAQQAHRGHDRQPERAGYFLVASDGGIFSYDAPFFGSLGGLPLKHPVVAASRDTGRGRVLVHRHQRARLELRRRSLLRLCPLPAQQTDRRHGGRTGQRVVRGRHVPVRLLRLRHQHVPVREPPDGRPPDRHRAGGRELLGATRTRVWPQEAAWAGGGLNLYTYLTYGTSTTPEPGCNGDTLVQRRLPGRRRTRTTDAQDAGAGSTTIPWWLDVETADANWSGNLEENARFVQGALNALHESEGIPDVGIYASPGVWNDIVGDYRPSVPYWMADYLASPSGPGTCADYQNWVAKGAQLPGPPRSCSTTASSSTRTTPASSFVPRTKHRALQRHGADLCGNRVPPSI